MVMAAEERRRSGRPKGEELVRLASQIPRRHDEMLREYARRHEITLTVALKRAIEKLIETEE